MSIKCYSDVRFVSKTGTSQYPYTSWTTAADSIPKCIKACNNGDTIYVANGVYNDGLYIDKEISLIGSSMDSTIIDGTGITDHAIESMYKLNLENFTILGKAVNSGVVILANSILNINSCRINNGGGGVYTAGGIVNNVIIQHCKYGFGGLCLSDTCHYYISNSIIMPDIFEAEGISTGLGTEFFINNNIIIYTYSGLANTNYGIIMSRPHRMYIYNNLISGFEHNIYTDLLDDTAFIKNNIISYKGHATSGLDWGSVETTHHNVVIRNNIFVDNPNSALLAYRPNADEDYNLFWNNENDLYGLSYGDSDIVADPMFIKDTVPTPLFNFD